VKLEEQEIECNRCEGTGKCNDKDIREKIECEWIESYIKEQRGLRCGDFKVTPLCRKCNGKGKLDWIRNIIDDNSNNLVLEIEYSPDSMVKYMIIDFFGEEDEA